MGRFLLTSGYKYACWVILPDLLLDFVLNGDTTPGN